MAEEERRRIPPSVRGFLRDLAVAFLIVAIVFGALFAFARTYPPIVVVESGSMQHNDAVSSIGFADTGDIVVVQAAPHRQNVITYVQGRASGYATYGDFGDVIIFQDPRNPPGQWTIHRPLLFLAWNETVGGFDIPTLGTLEQGRDWTSSASTPFGLGSTDWVLLFDVGFRGRDVTISMSGFLNQVDTADCPTSAASCQGYVTMGDNNAPTHDPSLIFQGLVVGRARGELPWFGLLKLVFSQTYAWGDPAVAVNSWTSLTIALVALVAGPIGLDILLSYLAPRRSKEKAANPGEDEDEAPSESEDDSREEGDEAAAK